MATSDLLGRTGASDTCVTTQSGGECEGGKGSTSCSTLVSNHCWGQGLVLWASRVTENYWPLWQATWPCLPLGSRHVSLVQDSTAVAYPSTACLKTKMVRAEQTRSEEQCGEIYVPTQLKQPPGNWLRSNGSYLPDECYWQWCKEGLSCKNGKEMKLSGTVFAWASRFSLFSLVALKELPVDNNVQISKLPSRCS